MKSTDASYRCLLGCERAEAASSFVSSLYRSFESTRAATSSIFAPVCFPDPR